MTWKIRHNEYNGYPEALEYMGWTVLHVVPSERTNRLIKVVAELLNQYQRFSFSNPSEIVLWEVAKMEIREGMKVRWKSGSTQVEKEGVVVRFLDRGENALQYIPNDGESKLVSDAISSNRRVLVVVHHEKARKWKHLYYAPLLKWLKPIETEAEVK